MILVFAPRAGNELPSLSENLVFESATDDPDDGSVEFSLVPKLLRVGSHSKVKKKAAPWPPSGIYELVYYQIRHHIQIRRRYSIEWLHPS